MSGYDRLPSGRPPWDPWNAARVGALAGVAVGALVVAFAGLGYLWIGLVVAALGAVFAYWREKRRQRTDMR